MAKATNICAKAKLVRVCARSQKYLLRCRGLGDKRRQGKTSETMLGPSGRGRSRRTQHAADHGCRPEPRPGRTVKCLAGAPRPMCNGMRHERWHDGAQNSRFTRGLEHE